MPTDYIYGQAGDPKRIDDDGVVEWNWHLAPALLVRDEATGVAGLMVIDPSLADGPLPIEEWKALMGNDAALVSVHERDQYGPGVTKNDEGFRDAGAERLDAYLEFCRAAGYC